jgi:XTP/dITP diphosphohydrolase
MIQKLVIATNNGGKMREFRSLLEGVPVHLLSLTEALTHPLTVVEDGATFAANAIKKASEIAQATGLLTLADDSGLEVDSLGGRPGIHSARLAHDHATDEENNTALLRLLIEHSNSPHRDASGLHRARFRCVLALVDPSGSGEPHVVDGVCEGGILSSPRGTAGFGYDPLFIPVGYELSLAELSPEVKNLFSHRAQAIRRIRHQIEEVTSQTNRSGHRNPN